MELNEIRSQFATSLIANLVRYHLWAPVVEGFDRIDWGIIA